MNNKTLIAIVIIICAVIAGGFALNRSGEKKEAKGSDKSMSSQAETSKKSEPKQAAASTPAAQSAKEVSVDTTYQAPSGEDKIGFVLSLDATGTIADAKIVNGAASPISTKWQQNFAENFPAAVKGKKLSELSSIDKVAGASLTTAAFNQSLAQLKAQM